MIALLLTFFLGLALLTLGADRFVWGAGGIARWLGVSPFVIGLTVVSVGTSAPEMAVSLSSVAEGTTDLALGNIVGSNIGNIGLILGLSALLRPLQVQMRLLRFELPVLMAAAGLTWLLARDLRLSRGDGALLGLGLLLFIGALARLARRESAAVRAELIDLAEEEGPHSQAGRRWAFLGLLGGLGLMVLGADWMVEAAVGMARRLAWSETLIGLSIVAVGTSLPELASSLAAARRGEADIAVGNVVGSNIFNLLLILAAAALLQPLPVAPALLRAELPALLLFSLALGPIAWRGFRVSRGEGALLLAGYLGFMGWMIGRGG